MLSELNKHNIELKQKLKDARSSSEDRAAGLLTEQAKLKEIHAATQRFK